MKKMNKMDLSKKIGIVLFVLVMLCSILPVASAETKLQLVPLEKELKGDPVDSPLEVVLVNNDREGYTVEDVTEEIRLDYNVSFEIISIDKGTFDEALIVNATTIRFFADEIAYGEERVGSAVVRISASSDVTVKVDVTTTVTVTDPNTGETVIKESKISATAAGEYNPHDKWLRIADKIIDLAKKIKDLFVDPVPEFPTVAIPVAAILGLMFLFSRRKRKE